MGGVQLVAYLLDTSRRIDTRHRPQQGSNLHECSVLSYMKCKE